MAKIDAETCDEIRRLRYDEKMGLGEIRDELGLDVSSSAISYHVGGECSHNGVTHEDNEDVRRDVVDVSIEELLGTTKDMPVGEDKYDVFGIVSSRRRRMFISVMSELDIGSSIGIGDLSRLVAALENDKGINQVDSQERKAVYVSFYQAHMDKIEDCGLIEWDSVSKVVTTKPKLYDVAEWIESWEDKSFRDDNTSLIRGWLEWLV